MIGDTHIPFEKKGYLDFCKETQEKFHCSLIVHIGDLVDNHACSFHDHDPDGHSHGEEMKSAKEKLVGWFDAFPEVKICKGNHDILVERKAMRHGLSTNVIKSFEEIWNLPDGWDYQDEHYIYGVLFTHGNGRSGMYAHGKLAQDEFCNAVMGHLHSNAGTMWGANKAHRYFGMAVGCGVDQKAYAMAYAKYFKRRYMIGCGVVTDSGNYAQFIPMKI